MRKAVSFNPHWIGDEPAWDIRLLNGVFHRSVTVSQIRMTSSRRYMDSVRECDIQDFGRYHLAKSKPHPVEYVK